jgi:hypothetical protein
VKHLSSTLQSESAEANCPSNKAASRWLSVQEELKNEVFLTSTRYSWDELDQHRLQTRANHSKKVPSTTKKSIILAETKKYSKMFLCVRWRCTFVSWQYLNNPITGCSAPALRTSFLMLGDEWTKFPITPT